MLGEPFVIPGCRFVSDLPVQNITFLWTKDGNILLEADYNSSSVNNQMTDLTFENTSIGDTGDYKCMATIGDEMVVQSQDSYSLIVRGRILLLLLSIVIIVFDFGLISYNKKPCLLYTSPSPRDS